jgi:hypothetical protein
MSTSCDIEITVMVDQFMLMTDNTVIYKTTSVPWYNRTSNWGHRDRLVVGFIITCAINAYHYKSC